MNTTVKQITLNIDQDTKEELTLGELWEFIDKALGNGFVKGDLVMLSSNMVCIREKS